MPLQLLLKQQSQVPISVAGVLPSKLIGLSQNEVEGLPIVVGKEATSLGNVFKISGQLDASAPNIEFVGDLMSVNEIGQGLDLGSIVANGNVGCNAGRWMTGGRMHIQGNVGNFCGAEMEGGQLIVDGDAGDFLGSNSPGSKYGMNRGLIVVQGNAGKSAARRMRRGTIVIVGNTQAGLGWEMLAGTVIAFGETSAPVGLEMKRGTIILSAIKSGSNEVNGSAFSQGPTYLPHVFPLISQSLQTDLQMPQLTGLFKTLVGQKYTLYHGDVTSGSRGEVFIAAAQ